MKESASNVDYDFDKEIGEVAKHLGMGIINQKTTSVFQYYASTRT